MVADFTNAKTWVGDPASDRIAELERQLAEALAEVARQRLQLQQIIDQHNVDAELWAEERNTLKVQLDASSDASRCINDLTRLNGDLARRCDDLVGLLKNVSHQKVAMEVSYKSQVEKLAARIDELEAGRWR